MRILFCLLAVALTGCGVDWNNPRPPTTKMELSLDAVKLIASDIGDPHDVRTFQQADYELHAQRNLLLRYEKLSEEYR